MNDVQKLVQKLFYSGGAVEPDNIVRQLIRNCDCKYGWTRTDLPCRATHCFPCPLLRALVFEKTAMLLPRHVDKHTEAMLDGFFKQPQWWREIDAHTAGTKRAYLHEVAVHL